MKILVTGSEGFIGKNLVAELKNHCEHEVFKFDRNTEQSLLDSFCRDAEFVFHLAGVNRPNNETEFMEGNCGFTSLLLSKLKEHKNNCTIMISSSIQAENQSPYGISKKAGEDLVFKYGKETGSSVLVYRFPNVYGKWSKPNYNSAVATFCHNIANGFEIKVNNPLTNMKLVYIDDVIKEMLSALDGNENREGNYCEVSNVSEIELGEIAKLIYSFKESRESLMIPNLENSFDKKLYSTYLSYLPVNDLSYSLKMHTDLRGSFTEFLKTSSSGQVSVNLSKPGVVKGNHWHHSKVEKFLVISGKGVIRLRGVNSDLVTEYFVNDNKFEVVEIPAGYTHNIENLGTTNMVTIMWVNEVYDPENPDTYFLEV